MPAETVELCTDTDSIADSHIIFYIGEDIVPADGVSDRSDIYIAESDKLSKRGIPRVACTRWVDIVYQRTCTGIYPAANMADGTG